MFLFLFKVYVLLAEYLDYAIEKLLQYTSDWIKFFWCEPTAIVFFERSIYVTYVTNQGSPSLEMEILTNSFIVSDQN